MAGNQLEPDEGAGFLLWDDTDGMRIGDGLDSCGVQADRSSTDAVVCAQRRTSIHGLVGIAQGNDIASFAALIRSDPGQISQPRPSELTSSKGTVPSWYPRYKLKPKPGKADGWPLHVKNVAKLDLRRALLLMTPDELHIHNQIAAGIFSHRPS